MFRFILAALLWGSLAAPVLAQGVQVTKTDGTVLTGDLEGYENGRYRIRLSSGATQEIPEVEVQEIVLSAGAAAQKPGSSAAASEAREAFDRGDLDGALEKIGLALQELDRQKGSLGDLAGRVGLALLDRLLEKKDAGRLGNALRQVVPTLSPESRREILSRLAERLAAEHRAGPGEAFTAALADSLARLAEQGEVSESLRGTLSEIFAQQGDAAASKKNFSSAASLYRGALKLDPSRRPALAGRLLEALLPLARQALETASYRGAAQTAREILALDPAQAEAKKILDEAEFTQVKSDLEASPGPEARAALRDYLARSPSPERRAWAERELARLGSQPSLRPPAVQAQMDQFFPVKVGRFLTYRRGDGDLTERVRTDRVERLGEAIRVSYTLDEIFHDHRSSKTFWVELEQDAVVLTAGPVREPLLKFPLRVGDFWAWKSGSREFRRTVLSLSDSVEVGPPDARRRIGGCLVIEFTSLREGQGTAFSITSRSAYAPGVGLVKLEFLDPEFARFNLDLIESGDE
jgi:tetratricopeptide (TPR) repeat protein